MGRSSTPKYVVEIFEGPPPHGKNAFIRTFPMEWQVKARYGSPGYGKPNNENLEKFIRQYARSLHHDGTNSHISKSLGYIPYPNRAIIRENYPGSPPIATWNAALFQVF